MGDTRSRMMVLWLTLLGVVFAVDDANKSVIIRWLLEWLGAISAK